MKKDLYDVYLCITHSESTCSPEYAFCQCSIGLAQSCSHIGSLLIAINNKERLQGYEENHGSSTGGGETSRTYTLCKWIVPRNA